jgi:Uma2 family endonuclease
MLNREQRTKFAPISPDFVVELRSKSDTLKDLQDKMQQYIDNGVRLGWLIDRKRRRVYIYRPGVAVQQLNNPETVTGLTQLSQARAQLRRALYQKTRQNA